ncbi:MAG: helix-turn-helix domain-containing protein, partial [Bacteroidota bacterium]
SFFIIRQSQFFKVDSQASNKPKYHKSSLNEAMEDELILRLGKLMQEKKPHLRNDLSLSILAKELHISRHHLSQILNDKLGLSFFDFVAKHRIEEAQAMLISPTLQHLKIEEIAERVGYNSKSAFNAAFKKWTSQTPSAYRKRPLS